MKSTQHVQAAVAYASSKEHPLVKDCHVRRIRCQVWSRHDHTLPTAFPVLEWAATLGNINGNFTWKLLGSFYHPKVIWWRGFGVYIGSANLTQAAWFSNSEAGTFIPEKQLEEEGLHQPLQDFFSDIDEQSHQITPGLLADARALLEREMEIETLRKQMRHSLQSSPHSKQFTQESLATVNKTAPRDRRRTTFLKEWNETLGYLRTVQARLAEPGNKPRWVPPDASPGIHTDQFLHAFYYTKVREGNFHPVDRWHAENRANPEAALRTAIEWWRNTPEAPENEDKVFNEWAPTHRELLTAARLEKLTSEDFARVLCCVHAFRNHAKYKDVEDALQAAEVAEGLITAKSLAYAREVYYRSNGLDWRPTKLLHYLIYGGPAENAPLRLFECLEFPYKIAGLDLSCLGELIGCAMPDIFTPRNDRTNKALRSLGWNVHVRSPNQE